MVFNDFCPIRKMSRADILSVYPYDLPNLSTMTFAL